MKSDWVQRCHLLLTVVFLTGTMQAGVVMKNFSFQQRWPWNGKVDIVYTVESTDKNDDGSVPDVKITFSGYDRDRNRTIELKSLTGDGAQGRVKPGGPYHLVWDAAKDYPNIHSSAFQIRASLESLVNEFPVRYLVVDLSGGASAEQYPVRYSATGPDLSKDACRTTELWLREIPAGTFMMGSPENELGRKGDETQHQVTLTRNFFMGVLALTQGQWQRVMGNLPVRQPYGSIVGDYMPVCASWNEIRGDSAGAQWPGEGHKVDELSFMGTLRRKTGLVFDLPTEAQWEYACRAGTTTALNSGKNLLGDRSCFNMDKVGRYDYNFKDGKGGQVRPENTYGSFMTKGGCYLPNNWGLYDMHGNELEICLDWYRFDLGTAAVTDPVGPKKGEDRVRRGGEYWDNSGECRSASRYSDEIYGGASEPHDAIRLVMLPEPRRKGEYLVIDLSGGPDAAKYLVRRSSLGPDLSDDTCRTTELWLRKVPAGRFTMGSPVEEPMRGDDEDQHPVVLSSPFYIGVFEVTQMQWQLVTGGSPAEFKGDTRPVDGISYDMIRGTNLGAGWPANGHRVDGTSFLGKLQAKTGLILDLPTDAQWEYACRAGTDTSLNSGKNLSEDWNCPNLNVLGRYANNVSDGRGGYSEHTVVGSYQPNAWGLYDMHGNVREWCLDWYLQHLGSALAKDPVGGTSGTRRVLRSGSWASNSSGCRSAYRDEHVPSDNGGSRGLRIMGMVSE